eukprot:c16913_g1_i1 orf=1-231(-)
MWFVQGDPKKVRLLFYLYNVPFGDGEDVTTKCFGRVMVVRYDEDTPYTLYFSLQGKITSTVASIVEKRIHLADVKPI